MYHFRKLLVLSSIRWFLSILFILSFITYASAISITHKIVLALNGSILVFIMGILTKELIPLNTRRYKLETSSYKSIKVKLITKEIHKLKIRVISGFKFLPSDISYMYRYKRQFTSKENPKYVYCLSSLDLDKDTLYIRKVPFLVYASTDLTCGKRLVRYLRGETIVLCHNKSQVVNAINLEIIKSGKIIEKKVLDFNLSLLKTEIKDKYNLEILSSELLAGSDLRSPRLVINCG